MVGGTFGVEASTVNGLVQGDHNTVTLVFNSPSGASADPAPANVAASPVRLPPPVRLLPPAFAGLVDREEEMNVSLGALAASVPVEVVGADGMGKTALLRSLSRHPALPALPDGIVFMEHRGEAVDDFLQGLFECFYDAPGTLKVSRIRIRQHLAAAQAVLLLDDVDVPHQDVETIRNAVSGCLVVTASRELVAGEGRLVAVRGLATDDALELFGRRLARTLTDSEMRATRLVCDALEGNPSAIVRAAAVVSTTGLAIADLVTQLASESRPATAVTRALVASLEPAARRVLGNVANLGGAALPTSVAADVTGEADAAEILSSLATMGLVRAHSPRYSAPADVADVADAVEEAGGVGPDRLVAWATSGSHSVEHRDLVLGALDRAARLGRWEEAIRLARALDPAVAASGRWSAWENVLRTALGAALAGGDRSAEGWALHELGTLSLASERYGEAGDDLRTALGIREAIGDKEGAALTRHNLVTLAALQGQTSEDKHESDEPTPPGHSPLRVALTVVAVVILLVAILAGGVLVFRNDAGPEQPTPTTPPPTAPSTNTTPTTQPVVVVDPFQLDIAQGASRTVTITGSGFGSQPTVASGRDVSVKVQTSSATRITASFSASATATPGPRTVTVTGGGGTSARCIDCIHVTERPVIRSVTPSTLAQGGKATFTITGTGFTADSKVTTDYRFVTVEQASRPRSTSLTVVLQAAIGMTKVGDCITLTVTNPDGGKATSGCIRIVSPPVD